MSLPLCDKDLHYSLKTKATPTLFQSPKCARRKESRFLNIRIGYSLNKTKQKQKKREREKKNFRKIKNLSCIVSSDMLQNVSLKVHLTPSDLRPLGNPTCQIG